MSSIEEIRSRISAINNETSRINNQRNQNIGRQETLKKQLSDAFAMYEKNYGVKLTVESLQTELANVTSKKEAELQKIEQILSCINVGNIAEANRLAGVSPTETTTSVQTPQQAVQTPVTSSIQGVQTPITPPNQGVQTPVTPPLQGVQSPVQTSQFGISEPPKITPPNFGVAEPPKVAPPTGALGSSSLVGTPQGSGMSALDGFTKNSLGSLPEQQQESTTVSPPPTNRPVQDFNAILNGHAFKQN